MPSYRRKLGKNFRSVSLSLGHIQPVATEKQAWKKAALCRQEIALLVAVAFSFSFFLFVTFTHQVGFTNSDDPLLHHLVIGLPAVTWNVCVSLMCTGQTFAGSKGGEAASGPRDPASLM